jgi:hypothetical protein
MIDARDPDTAAAIATLLAEIAIRTKVLLGVGREVLALPAETEALLQAAADGHAVDPDELPRARAAAETLRHKLVWQCMKLRAGL